MGLGVHLAMSIVPGDGEPLLDRERILARIEGVARSFADQLQLSDFYCADCTPRTLAIGLHPGEEEIEFEFGANRLEVRARTSSCGPGYHAAVIRFLDEIGRTFAAKWDGDGDLGDETGYFEHRDFHRLQMEMAAWLRGVSRSVFELDESYTGIAISLPVSPWLESTHAVLTPLGPRSRDYFCRLSELGDEEILGASEAWFIWPNLQQDASFWFRTALSCLWVTMPWHTPSSDRERAFISGVLSCLAQAKVLDPSIDLPAPEIQELIDMKEGRRGAQPPSVGGIGYRRETVRFDLGGGWSIALPGYWYSEYSDGRQTFYFGPDTIHASSFTFTTKAGPIALPALRLHEVVLEQYEKLGASYRMTRSESTEEGEALMTYATWIGLPNACLLLSFVTTLTNREEQFRTIVDSIRAPTAA